MKPLAKPGAVYALLLLMCACGSDRGDPVAAGSDELEYGGSLYSGGELANARVSAQTQYVFCNQIFPQVYRAYYAALPAAGTAPENIDIVRIIGARKGSASVDASALRVILEGYSFVQFDATVTFNDFSDDGRLYIGGEIAFNGIWRDLAAQRLPDDINMRGGVNFAGDYRGSVMFTGLTASGFKLLTDTLGILIPAGNMATGYETDGFLVVNNGESTLTIHPYPVPTGNTSP
jgi:hypothetical protein